MHAIAFEWRARRFTLSSPTAAAACCVYAARAALKVYRQK
jgi:hypothetical protein